MKIRVGDTVLVRRGKDKGKTGKVLEVNHQSSFIKVEGVNKSMIHRKPRNENEKGGLFEEFQPIHVSKVGIEHPSKKGATTRIGYSVDSKGKKKRIMKANQKEVKNG